MSGEIKLVLDQDVVDKYSEFYFKEHPKARKKPIEKPWHPSINQWCILPRIQMNSLKQKWKDFTIWWIKELGYENMEFDNFTMDVTVFKDSKRRADPDNYVGKFQNDGFVESGFLKDDDGEHMKSLTIKTRYDKDHPRTEIVITDLND